MAHPSDPELLQRIERLERSVELLTQELRELREHPDGIVRLPDPRPRAAGPVPDVSVAVTVAGSTAASASTAQQPSRPSASPPPPPRAGFDISSTWTAEEVEGLVGRYGMLALATLTGLAAVGTFLGWAITQGFLGPKVRLGLGLLLAAGLAATGAWLRPRERSFGAALLGIALAVVHVCAWSMSPASLGLVSTPIALAFAVLASVALAVFAHREDDEPLWCVGFGGAAIAPYVTSSGAGSAPMLTLYGAAVLLLGSWALRQREWRIAARIHTASAALFVGSLLAMPHATGSPLMALGLTALTATAGVLPFTAPALRRGRLRVLGALAAIAAIACVDSGSLPLSEPWVLLVVAATALGWLVLVDATSALPVGSILDGLLDEGKELWEWVDGALVPLLFIGAIIVEVDGAQREMLAAMLAAGTLAVFVRRRVEGALRDAAVLTLAACVLVATWEGTRSIEDWRVAACAVVGAALVAGSLWRPAWTWIAVGVTTLFLATMGAWGLLATRTAFDYVPFGTRASVTAALAAAAWFATARLLRDSRWLERVASRELEVGTGQAARVFAWMVAFGWVHQELARAISPVASTLLLISYYAVTSVVTVWIGRARGLPILRHVGLGFAIVAAIAAARGAARLDEVWARVAGYLVTSAFMLALAWWYRRRAGSEEPRGHVPRTSVP